jgi:hypothetical protein
MGPLTTLSAELARWYGRRLKYLWITTVTGGLGFFVLYAVLVVAGVLLARQSLLLRAADEKRLDDFLQSEHEVRDDDHFASALSVVLSAVDKTRRISKDSCPVGSTECLRARRVLTLTAELAQALEERPSSGSEHWLDGVVELLSQNDVHRKEASDIATALSLTPDTRVPDEQPPQPADTDGDCDRTELTPVAETAANEFRASLGLVPAFCDRAIGDLSSLLIPEQAAHIPRRVEGKARARVGHATYISSALEAALKAVVVKSTSRDTASNLTRADSAQSDDMYSFVAAYFIGVDSVIRYWHVEPGEPIERLPRNRSWAAQEHFAQFLDVQRSSAPEYVSRPYLDFAGAGVVQTICRRVSTHGASETTVPGIVCVDLALQRKEMTALVGRIQEGPFVSAGLLRIDPNGTAVVASQPNKGSREDLDITIHSLRWQQAFTPQFLAGAASRSTSRVNIGVGFGTWYVVPLGRVDKDLLAVALRPALGSGVGRLGRWALLGGIFGAAFILLTFTAQQSRRLSVAERDLARLRGLATAVIECRPDPNDPENYLSQSIVTGNDRAEEVLQTRLPNFGFRVGAKPKLKIIFDGRAFVAIGADGFAPTRKIEPSEIEPNRRRDDASSYYVRLIGERQVRIVPPAEGLDPQAWPRAAGYRWLRVAASAVVLPRWLRNNSRDARGRMVSTIGIVVPVWDQDLVRRLDAIVDDGETQKVDPSVGADTRK